MIKGRILIVEPDEDIAHMLRIYLSGQGYKVWMRELGQAISDLARELIEPDVLLLANDKPPWIQPLDHLDMYVLVGKMPSEKQIIYLVKEQDRTSQPPPETADYNVTYKPFDIEILRDRVAEIFTGLRGNSDD
jgi:DNA-binding response OmpR family regulator